MKLSAGISDIAIGLIDGPVALRHPALDITNIREVSPSAVAQCLDENSLACTHGTFVAGVLSGKRESIAPGICPGCTLLARPVFAEANPPDSQMPAATAGELAQAIVEVIEAGARLINLSVALMEYSAPGERELKQALDFAARAHVIVISAAGNHGALRGSVITRHPWVMPVVAYDSRRELMPMSNLGSSIGERGVGAAGEAVTSLRAVSGSLTISGTSAATPFVTGAAALLWSCLPQANAMEIKLAVLGTRPRRVLAPPLLNAEAAYERLAHTTLAAL
ncbi:MAG: S8 family serine peptidase [Candidatus Binataceae bacterium]